MKLDVKNARKRYYTLFRALFIASKMLVYTREFMAKYGYQYWKSYHVNDLTPEELADKIVDHAESPQGIEYYDDPDDCSV